MNPDVSNVELIAIARGVVMGATWVALLGVGGSQWLVGRRVTGVSLVLSGVLGLGLALAEWGVRSFLRTAPERLDEGALRWVAFGLDGALHLVLAILLGLIVAAAAVERAPRRA